MTETLIGPAAPPALHVMTLNVRRRLPAVWRVADRWEHRAPRLRALLRTERPTLVGMQECLPEQAEFARASLGEGYRLLGRGRGAEGRGEGCPILYDSRRLEVLDWHQRALSDRPDEPGSVSWGNHIPRILVTASLRDRTTGARVLAANTHFDHLSRRSRTRSAREVRLLVEQQELPAIVTGDLNTGENTEPIRELFEGGVLADAWERAAERATARWGTFANYRAPRHGRKRIDWIAVSPGIEVDRVAINPLRHEGGWASDHLPVQATLRLPAVEGES